VRHALEGISISRRFPNARCQHSGRTAGAENRASSVISISILLCLYLNNALGFLIRIRITKKIESTSRKGEGEWERLKPLAAGAIVCNDIVDHTGLVYRVVCQRGGYA